MRAELLAQEGRVSESFLKMSLNEIISFLQNSQYKKEAIDDLAVKYSGSRADGDGS